MNRLVGSILCAAIALIAGASAAPAMTIEKIVSPAGIEAWLVREKAVPLVTLNYAFPWRLQPGRAGQVRHRQSRRGSAR